MSDYSQWGEQVIIKNFFGDFHGRFLDIGAFDGMTGSNTRALAESEWGGVCVEANPENFIKLLNNYKSFPYVQCVNCAVGLKQAGLAKFNNPVGQCGTLMEGPESPFYWVACVIPLNLKVTFGEFDFVSVDVEGTDYDLIRELLLHITPKLLCFEDDIPGTRDSKYKLKMLSMLSDFGYTKIVGTTSTPDRSCNTLVAKP